jgi:hypothetical protein
MSHPSRRRSSDDSIAAACRRAFSQEEHNVKAQAELDPEIARIVERLKKTQAVEDAEAGAEGRLLGSNWAKESATAKELRELAVGGWEESYNGWQPRDENSIWFEFEGDTGVFEGDDGKVENWLTVAFTRGVLRGARDVYEQVRHLI